MSGVASPSKPDRSAAGSGTSGGGGTTPFFGRQSELEQFEAELRNPRTSAILVVGQQAMGKSVLLKEFIEQAQHDPSLKCRAAWFSVTQGDSAELTMSLIMSDAEGEAVLGRTGRLEWVDRRWSEAHHRPPRHLWILRNQPSLPFRRSPTSPSQSSN